VGVDRAWQGLRRAKELATQAGVAVSWIQADLKQFHLSSDAFDLIVCSYYRDPALYPSIRTALRPGGTLVYQTFTCDQLHFAKGPRNPAHLLEPGELLNAFVDWNLIFYREAWSDRGEAALVARKPKPSGELETARGCSWISNWVKHEADERAENRLREAAVRYNREV